MQSDSGGEYFFEDLKSHFVERRINHRFTSAYTPEQNGAAERMNQTLVTSVRSMLQDKNLPKSMWTEAFIAAPFV